MLTLSSHLRLRRLTILTIFVVIVLILYLMTSCWSTIFNLFDHRIGAFDDLRQRGRFGHGSCLFSWPYASLSNDHDDNEYLHQQIRHSTSRHRSSLLVRPFNYWSKSFSTRELTHEKVESLIKLVNQSTSATTSSSSNCINGIVWRKHQDESHQTRLERLERICREYDFTGRIFMYRSITSNRRYVNNGNNSYESRFCSTKTCPMLVDRKHSTMVCFVQKVASTSIKQLFVHLIVNDRNESLTEKNETLSIVDWPTPLSNLTAFHFTVNDGLYRMSPVLSRRSKEYSYFKGLFVRHPFVRLVSAFKDKAERTPEQEPFFYAKYWNPIFDEVYGEGRWNHSTRITFQQFIELILLRTDPYQYDEHWAPIWTRCEPCLVHYDFIGKLESSEHDFQSFRTRIDERLHNLTIWENRNQQFGQPTSTVNNDDEQRCRSQMEKFDETARYLAQINADQLIQLYKRYYLDFELFGYTFDELFIVH